MNELNPAGLLEGHAPRSLTETIADLEMEADHCEQMAMQIRCAPHVPIEMEERAISWGRQARALRKKAAELRGESNVVQLFDDRPAS